MKEYILKVTSPEGPGSAFIVSISEQANLAYIITARHCLVNSNEEPYENHEISISFLHNGSWVDYQLQASDHIHLGKNIDTEDIGVIVVQKQELPVALNYASHPRLCLPPQQGELVITGVPKVTNNELKRSLFDVKFLEDKDYEQQIQIEANDPMTKEYNADNLVEGYSGGPLIIKNKGQEFICGIFLRYEEKTKRILAIDLSLLNALLIGGKHEQISLLVIESNKEILSAMDLLNANTERVLGRIRSNIGALHIEREEVGSALKKAIYESKLAIVTGVPGCGKSAVVKKALSELENEYTVLALQGEQLDRLSLHELFKQAPFNFAVSPQEVFDSPVCKVKKIVLVDSVEKILETENAETILDFFELLHTRTDIKLVLTCRSYAVEQLKIRFLQQFPSYPRFDVPLFGKKELDMVVRDYPHVSPLLANPSLSKILTIPFNLDKAVLLPASSFDMPINSEQEFGKIMWEYVIENRTRETNAVIRRQRADLFTNIALERASSMVPYVNVQTKDAALVEQLVSDNIVDKEPVLGQSYAAAHDIYEDWALTRHVHQKFLDIVVGLGNYQDFYTELGNAPAVRRAFRLWFSEQIQQTNDSINEMVSRTLTDTKIANHWKDEIIVAIMQSPYSKIFLDENAELIFEDNGKLLTRVVFLLQVACQQPDFSYLNNLEPEDRLIVYHNVNLVPFGEGWPNIIDFLYSHLDRLDDHIPLVIRTIMQWSKGVASFGELPQEARHAGLMVLRYFKEFENGCSDDFPRSSNSGNIGDCILLLFRLSDAVREEVEEFIDVAFRVEAEDNYTLSYLRDKVIELVLSGYDNYFVCKNYPELVLEIAESEWFYYAPTQEEIDRRIADDPYYHRRASSLDNEPDFGLKTNTRRGYFPASPEQTPILNLLSVSPGLTLKFLVKFLNHVADTFVQTEYAMNSQWLAIAEERNQVKISLGGGKENTQHASITLWTAFRGTYIAIPSLLESVLMGLESYLLTIGELITNSAEKERAERYKATWDICFDTILQKTNSVLASSVLLSVAQAYRDLAAEKILPLLRIKEIYLWDDVRLYKERDALSPISIGKNAIEKQHALWEFQHLPHRKRGLQELVINLSLGRYGDKVLEILDELRTLYPDDDRWQIRVGNMDRRTFKVTGEVENGLLVEASHEGKLKEIVEEGKKELDEQKLMNIALTWCLKKHHNESVDQDTYNKWKEHYQTTEQAIKENRIRGINIQPGLLAGIGLRDFYDDLTKEEKGWCVAKIMNILQYELFDAGRNDFMHVQHSSFEKEVALSILPKLMYYALDKAELRRYVFAFLIRSEDKFEKKHLISSIHSFLWQADPKFMMDCIRAMLQYSEIAQARSFQGIMVYKPGSPKNLNEFTSMIKVKSQLSWKNLIRMLKGEVKEKTLGERVTEAEITYNRIVKNIGEGNLDLNLDGFNFDGKSAHYLFEVLRIIPRDTEIVELRKYYFDLLKYVLDNIDRNGERWEPNERFHHELLRIFKKRLTAYILHQPDEVALDIFKLLTDWAYDPNFKTRRRDKIYEFVNECLEEIIRMVIMEETKSEKFWKLWEYLIQRDLELNKAPFAKKVLLNDVMFSSTLRAWQPLAGKNRLYEKYICSGYGVESAVRLIGGIGFNELVPDGISWLGDLVKADAYKDEDVAIYFERLIIQCYYNINLRKRLKSNANLRESFITILDFLINQYASSCAYIIREDFISLKN